MIKNGLESTFSEDNLKVKYKKNAFNNVLFTNLNLLISYIQKAVDNINDFGEKLKDLGTKTFDNVQNALKKDETATAAPTA